MMRRKKHEKPLRRALLCAAATALALLLSACSGGRVIAAMAPDAAPDTGTDRALALRETPADPPAVLTQPSAEAAPVGTELLLSVEAGGEELRYQWQSRRDEGSEWIDCRGAGSDTATLTLLLRGYHEGYQFRCQVSNSGGEALSEPVTIHLLTRPSFTFQPRDRSAAAGDVVRFRAEAVGGNLRYQWYFRSSAKGVWKACGGTGSNSPEYVLTVREYHDGYQYRCEAKNTLGTAYSDIVTLTLY